VRDQISFSATFASAQPMDYRWQVINGGGTNDIAGATGSTLTLNNLQLTDTAAYQLMASNALGVAVSPPAYLNVNPVPAPVNNIVTTIATQSGLGSGTFTPVWTVVTNGSLIAGQVPSSSSGNFSMEISGRNVNSLTQGGSSSLAIINAPVGYTTTTNYVTCGNGSGAGSLIVYTLTGSATGYSLTNIVVYGGWADAGRDQQAYTLAYSTMAAPTNFIVLTNINFLPNNPANAQMATRISLTPAAGALATNVAAVKFDFSTPASENGFCGYSAITLFGRATLTAMHPALSWVMMPDKTRFMMTVGSLSLGQNYVLQSTTNLMAGNWYAETNFTATQASVVFTNWIINYPQKFYRVVAY